MKNANIDRIEHIHMATCQSTQDYLKDLLSAGPPRQTNPCPILVSTESQTKGRGRHSKIWDQGELSIAFSFWVPGSKELMATGALLVSTMLAEALEQFFLKASSPIFLKWPNDLFIRDEKTKAKKCAGVLGEVHKASEGIIFGIGINLISGNSNYGGLYNAADEHQREFLKLAQSNFPCRFAFTFKKSWRHRLSSFHREWENRCLHLERLVEVETPQGKKVGKFKGLGDNGQAIIEQNGKLLKAFSGGLRVKD